MRKAGTQEIARLLREYAQRSALRGGNPYRAKAYSRAADSLAALAVPIEQLIEEDRLTEVPGIGEAIADIVTKLHRTGPHPSLEKLRQDIPAGVLELLSVPGLRPQKVLRLAEGAMGLKDPNQFMACLKAGSLAATVNGRNTPNGKRYRGLGTREGFEAHCSEFPEWGREAMALVSRNAVAAQKRKGDRLTKTHCKRGHLLAGENIGY